MQFFETLVAAIAPHRCLQCQQVGDLLCGDCLNRLKVSRRPACFSCNKFSPSGRTCENCRRKHALDGVTVGAFYDEPMREFIAKVKYERAGSQAALGVSLLEPVLFADEFDVVTWVPAVPKRARQRGYNQAEVLARALAKGLQLDCRPSLRRRSGSTQVGSSRRSRLAQVKGQFYPARQLSGQRVLLVDDVLTTGATMGECARELKKAGAKSVWGAAIAKH